MFPSHGVKQQPLNRSRAAQSARNTVVSARGDESERGGGMAGSKVSMNLQRGWPNVALLPVDLIKASADHALSDLSIAYDGLCYGPDPGYEPAREAVAAWLNAYYAPAKAVTPNHICITGGASQNLACVLSAFSDPEYTRNIWLVSPSYMMVFRIFEDHGFGKKMRAVPEDDEGVDLEYLRREMHESEREARRNGNHAPKYKTPRRGAKIFKHIIYCVPSFANPSSRTMTLARRQGLVSLARELDALIVPDDVYDFLRWSANPQVTELSETAELPRLVDIDRELDGGVERAHADGFGNACSNGSFSKLAAPGMRSGWLQGSEKLVYGLSQTGEQASGGAPSQLTSTYITRMLSSGLLKTHIDNVLRPAYATRYGKLIAAINEDLLPLGCTLPQSTRKLIGGYFVWLGLPPGVSAQALSARCREQYNLVVAPGGIFEVPDETSRLRFDDHLRLCFAWEEECNLSAGVRRLGQALRQELVIDQFEVASTSTDSWLVVDNEVDLTDCK